jgi:hypothetical protein
VAPANPYYDGKGSYSVRPLQNLPCLPSAIGRPDQQSCKAHAKVAQGEAKMSVNITFGAYMFVVMAPHGTQGNAPRSEISRKMEDNRWF